MRKPRVDLDSRKWDKLIVLARRVISLHNRRFLANDSRTLHEFAEAIRKATIDADVIPTFDVIGTAHRLAVEAWLEKEFWTDEALKKTSEDSATVNRMKTAFEDCDEVLYAVIRFENPRTMVYRLAHCRDGRIAYYCPNDQGIYISLSKFTQEELCNTLHEL